jgi:hypothetical protein
MPTVIVSWYSATRQPRRWGGLISERYNGKSIEAIPTPTPPTMRAAIRAVTD